MNPTENFSRNLLAIERRDRALAERLGEPVRSDHLRMDEDGWMLRHRRSWRPLSLVPRAVEAAAVPASGEQVVVLGIGAGELVARALDPAQGVLRVHAWEPDPWVLRAALMHNDWSQAIQSGQLRISMGADLLRLDRSFVRWTHPIAKVVYARELAVFDHEGQRALIVAGELAVDDLAFALERTGVSPWTMHATRDSVDELAHTARVVGAERIYSINYVDGLAQFAEERGLELFIWEIDPSTANPRALQEPSVSTHVFCHRRANIERWRAAGFSNVHYLPLAANPDRRRTLSVSDVDPRYHSRVSFVGSSMYDNAEVCRARFLDGLTSGIGLNPDLSLSVMLRLLDVQEQHESFVLDACWDMGPFADLDTDPFRGEDPVMLVGEVAASQRRLGLAGILADEGLSVWGDEGWEQVPGLDYRGPTGHLRELEQVMGGTQLVLDMPRIYQDDIVTLRVFDSLAVTRAVLSPHNAALEELFIPGEEILTYRSPQELLRLTRDSLERPQDLAKIAARGHDRVMREHTFDHRLLWMHTQAETTADSHAA